MSVRRVAYVLNVFPKLSETFIAHELLELRRRGVALLVLSLQHPTDSIRHHFIASSGLDTVTNYEPRTFLPALPHRREATKGRSPHPRRVRERRPPRWPQPAQRRPPLPAN